MSEKKGFARITQIAAAGETLYALTTDGKVHVLVNVDDGWREIPSVFGTTQGTDDTTSEPPSEVEWTDKNPHCGRLVCGLNSPHTHRGGR